MPGPLVPPHRPRSLPRARGAVVHAASSPTSAPTSSRSSVRARGDDTRAWGPPYLKDAHGPRHERGGVLPALQPRQALGRGRLHARRTARRSCAALARARRRARRELQGRRAREVRARLRDAVATVESAHRLLLDHRLRPGRAVRASAPATTSSSRACRGFMSVTGEPDDVPGGGPQKAGVAITDLVTGMFASTGILAALAHRERTGDGQHLDTLPARLRGRDDVGDEPQLPGRPASRRGALGNAHPNIVPVPGVRVRRRPRDPRRRQRFAVREVLRGRGHAGMGARCALRDERRPRARTARRSCR